MDEQATNKESDPDDKTATRETGLSDQAATATKKENDSDDQTASREIGLGNQVPNMKDVSVNQTANKKSDWVDQKTEKENDWRPPPWWKDAMNIERAKTAAEVSARLTAMAAKFRQRDVGKVETEIGVLD